MPIIKTNIVWAKESYKELHFENAQIEIDNGEIWLKGRMNSSDWHIFSGAYPAYVDFSADIKKSFHFEQANIEGKQVKMNLDGTMVSYRHFMDRLKGYTEYSFKFFLKSFVPKDFLSIFAHRYLFQKTMTTLKQQHSTQKHGGILPPQPVRELPISKGF